MNPTRENPHMTPAAPLTFWFDFISPYGWFASRQIDELAARHGRSVDWRPMLLGVSVMKVMGLKPLLDTPIKGDYVERDVRRHARRLGLRMAREPRAPVMNPLPAARAMAWCRAHHPVQARAFAQAVYAGYWERAEDYSTPDALAGPARAAGLDAQALTCAAAGEEAAALLRAEVDASLGSGVFGSPTVVVDGEPFWGFDRLPDVDRWLSAGGW